MPRARISSEIAARVREAARYRCGYCLAHQDFVYCPLQIEHQWPVSMGGTNDESNLWLCCSICNGHKSEKTRALDPVTRKMMPLFKPRFQKWSKHFRWTVDGIRLIGLTATGRATIAALHLNTDSLAIQVRQNWVNIGWHPPRE